jgi:phosphotriesterase-related protein
MMIARTSPLGALTRREALAILGAGAGIAFLPELEGSAALLAAQRGRTTRVTFPKGAVIRTLFKDVPPDQFSGTILFHEHLSIDLPAFGRPASAPPPPPPPTSNIALIVDDMKRKLENLKEISTRTGMPVVASGGYYMERVYPPEVAAKSDDQLAAELAEEAAANRFGAFGEIGENPDRPMSALEQKVFRAIGKAHVKTNLPIFTHNAYGTGPNVPKDAGLHQLDVLESVGVKPQHIVIGHSCCLDDPSAAVLKAIAKRGAFVGFDRVGGMRPVPDEQKVRTLLAFFDAGYADHLLLSSDSTGGPTPDAPAYQRTTSVFLPLLRQAGVKDETIRAILVDNSRRFLAFVPR